MNFEQIKQEMASDAFLFKYEYAITEVKRILGEISQEKKALDSHKKIEYITWRIKSPESAVDKL